MDVLTLLTSILIIALSYQDDKTGCRNGFYGYKCLYKCGGGCRNKTCTASNFGTYTCTDGCIDGYAGDSCRFICPPLCDKCERYNTPHCLQCQQFRYGRSCEKNCKKTCPYTDCDPEGRCKSNKTRQEICGVKCQDCNMRLGICRSCKDGFYGAKCQFLCNKNCRCPHDNAMIQPCLAECDKPTGRCLHGCVVSYFGPMCQFSCSDNCADGICEMDTGVCLRGCKKGYFGEKCESGCNENCRKLMCNVSSGQCSEGCADGYYGAECTMECSMNCVHKVCQRKEGNCINGCTEGYYGQMCKDKCSQTCTVCNRYTGECIIAAKTKETVATTTQTTPQLLPSNANYTYTLVGGGVGIILLVLTTVSCICFCRLFVQRRRRNAINAFKNNKMTKQFQDAMEARIGYNDYSEICEDYFKGDRATVKRTNYLTASLPAAERSVPSAPLILASESFDRESNLEITDLRTSRGNNHLPFVMMDKGQDTVVVVRELNVLLQQEDTSESENGPNVSKCRDQLLMQGNDINEYLSPVKK